VIVLLLATGFYHHTRSLPRISSQAAVQRADSKQDSSKDQPEKDSIPKWLRKLIHELEAAPPADRPDRIIRCRYRNEFVYLLEAKCCDRFNSVYGTNGKLICSTGGLKGRGDGKCPDFYSERKDEKVIWEDKSKRS
jgi:hypothetical protein